MTIRYISLFSGGFGLDLGVEAAATTLNLDVELAACLDIDKASRETIRKNRPNVRVIGDNEQDANGDLYKLSTQYILEQAGLRVGEVDLVIGGPPCQAFSILGNRQGFEDPRGNLMLEFVRVVREAQPKAFIMENVSGFLSLHNGAAYQQVYNLFQQCGYTSIERWILNAVNYGVPQFRERVFLIGFLPNVLEINGIQKPPSSHRPAEQNQIRDLFTLLQENENLPPHRTVRDVLFNLPENLENHQPRIHGERVAARYANLQPGDRDTIDHTDKLRWDRPSGTVLVGSSAGGGRPFIHPGLPRHLTVREAARLQDFPDDWLFQGTQTEQYRQVGNAVPKSLGKAVLMQVLPCIAQERPVFQNELNQTIKNREEPQALTA